MADLEMARRWRLILGRYADRSLAEGCSAPGDLELDQLLGYLYDREYTSRGLTVENRTGGRESSVLRAVTWLERSRELFTRDTFERLQTQAVTRYGLTELLADPQTAETLAPSPQLAAALLALRGKLDAKLEAGLRTVIAKVVADIIARLRPVFSSALRGRRNRFRRSVQPRAQDLDWRATIRQNLKNYDPDCQRLMIDQVRFNARAKRHLPWDVIICLDQSGSMAESILYASVCAAILAGLPGVSLRLLAFDTAVVDLTDQAHDPVGVLMTAQLGGGTNIADALAYAETLAQTPKRTVMAVISDFEEGGSVAQLLATVARLRGAGVTLLGLAALSDAAEPVYDHRVAALLAERGMEIAALTPEHLAEWLAEVMA